MNPTHRPGVPDRHPLASALEGIAAGASRAHAGREATGAGLAIADVRAAARRRRTRVEAGAGLVAATVVGALVLGGAALNRAERPEPPAETTGPTPTDTAPGCGTTVAEQEFLDSPLVIEVELERLGAPVEAGVPITGRVTVADSAGTLGPDDLPTDLAAAVRYWLVDDAGAVVATASNEAVDAQGLSGRLASSTPIALDARSCAGGPVPAGEYSLMTVLPASATEPGRDGLLATARVPLSVAAAGPVVADLPACGGGPVEWSASGPPLVTGTRVRVGRLDPESGAFVHEGYGDTLSIEVEVTNEGPELYDASGIQVDAVILQNGAVVAQLLGGHSDPAPQDWPTGEVRSGELTTRMLRCDGTAGESLPAGEYLLWTRVVTSGAAGPGATPTTYTPGVGSTWFTVYEPGDPELYGPVTYTDMGEQGWSEADLSAVPDEVPVALQGTDAAVGVRAYEDGRRWHVSVYFETSGEQAYANARAALVSAGFTVVDEDAEPHPDGWAWGDFARDGLRVHVDTNTTGAGWYGDYLIVRTT